MPFQGANLGQEILKVVISILKQRRIGPTWGPVDQNIADIKRYRFDLGTICLILLHYRSPK